MNERHCNMRGCEGTRMEAHTRGKEASKSGAQKPMVATPEQDMRGIEILTILSPLVLTADLLLLLWGEVVGDVEGLSDLFWRLALDHVGDGLATNIEERLDVEVVGGLENILASCSFCYPNMCEPTRMISNNISWSTCMNFWSHSSISVVFLRESASSSAAVTGSPLWCSHHSMTLRRTASLTWEGTC